MYVKYFLVFLCLLTACLSLSKEESFDEKRRKITHAVLREFTREMRTKGFNAEGIGEEIDHSNGKQKWLKVAFGVTYLPNVEHARELLIQTIVRFLDCINSKEGIQNYLTQYPFDINFISISFVNHSKQGLAFVYNIEDSLHYYIRNPNDPSSPSVKIHCETFDEAVRILAEQEKKVLIESSI